VTPFIICSPYNTLVVTDAVASALGAGAVGGGKFVLAFEGTSPVAQTWPKGMDSPGGVMAQLVMSLSDGRTCTVATETDSGKWTAAGVDGYYNPTPAKSGTFYEKYMENTPGRSQPAGGVTLSAKEASTSGWARWPLSTNLLGNCTRLWRGQSSCSPCPSRRWCQFVHMPRHHRRSHLRPRRWRVEW
jgi:hypothetical protein